MWVIYYAVKTLSGGRCSCGNFAAIEIGTNLLCVPHAAAQDLKKVLREKTFGRV